MTGARATNRFSRALSHPPICPPSRRATFKDWRAVATRLKRAASGASPGNRRNRFLHRRSGECRDRPRARRGAPLSRPASPLPAESDPSIAGIRVARGARSLSVVRAQSPSWRSERDPDFRFTRVFVAGRRVFLPGESRLNETGPRTFGEIGGFCAGNKKR